MRTNHAQFTSDYCTQIGYCISVLLITSKWILESCHNAARLCVAIFVYVLVSDLWAPFPTCAKISPFLFSASYMICAWYTVWCVRGYFLEHFLYFVIVERAIWNIGTSQLSLPGAHVYICLPSTLYQAVIQD